MAERPVRPRCAKRVFSGERMDISGHRCGHPAKEGSDFCHIHGEKPPEDREPRPAKGAPTSSVSSVTKHHAALRWPDGYGPAIPVPNGTGLGFINDLEAHAIGMGRAYVTMKGVKVKKDGTPSAVQWSSGMRELIPAPLLDELLGMLEDQRHGS